MFDRLLALLFPERCCACQKNGTALCASCIKTISPAHYIETSIPAMALFDYGDKIVQKAVWELKYHRKSSVAKSLVISNRDEIHQFLSDVVQSTTSLPIVLVPIPQHFTKTWSRGFNQSLLIAKWFAPTLPHASVQPLLHKVRATTSQAHTSNRTNRQENLKHSMVVKKTVDTKALYIIVDDVITTGSTIHEAGRALRAAGAKHIVAIALAYKALV